MGKPWSPFISIELKRYEGISHNPATILGRVKISHTVKAQRPAIGIMYLEFSE
jgi:hypothetical protein